VAEDKDGPDYQGPYEKDTNGIDAFGHPVNAYGRCEPMNQTPPKCPPAEEATNG
jgi:hypothetical protein